MKIVVITDNILKEELLAQGIQDKTQVVWLEEPAPVKDTVCYIDLLFQPSDERITILQKLQPAIVIANSVVTVLKDLPGNFIRFNGWNTFLKRPVIEAVAFNPEQKTIAENIFSSFNKRIEWVPDIPGFITCRVISMIINEAYFALAEKISSKDEIDIAMKLGTNYPYGPFEWSKKIGLKNVYELLNTLAQQNIRYETAPLLKKEALLT